MADFTFYVGTNNPSWLWGKPNRHPLFVSVRRLDRYASLKPANTTWCLDSGGFTELTMFDGWRTSPAQYVDSISRIVEQSTGLQWASPQDWMCEPHMLKKTGKTIEQHQHLTCENFCTLQGLRPAARIIPVLQGWASEDYLRHYEMYAQYGITLAEHKTVGMGSVCRRANVSGIRELVIELSRRGVKMHGFGLKKDGLKLFREHLCSSDSMAWSLTGRFEGRKGRYLCGVAPHRAKTCGDCHRWAMMWADDVANTQQQGQLLLTEAYNG